MARVYSSGSSVGQISKDKTIASGLTICKYWDLSIDLKLPKQSSTKWIHVFGPVIEDPTFWHNSYGNNLVSVWIQPHKQNVMLSVTVNPVGHPDDNKHWWYKRYDIPTEVKTDTWFNLKVNCIKKIKMMLFEIIVDGKRVHEAIKNPDINKKWENVKIVTGITFSPGPGWDHTFKSAVGEYRNFEINSCSKKSKTVFFSTRSSLLKTG